MVTFFTVGHNSFANPGYPWITEIVSGLREHRTPCPDCGAVRTVSLLGDLEVKLEEDVGRRWPDVLGCGAVASLLIVSGRVLEDWGADGIGNIPAGGRVLIRPPMPAGLRSKEPPEYFWVDETNMAGARQDLEASGFVGSRFCATCGSGFYDIGATYRRQHSEPWSNVLVEGSWNGADLFTAPSSQSTLFQGGELFCTEKVVKCARRHRHTNFRFVPADANQNHATGWAGVDYLAERWPPQWYPPAPSAGKSVDQWLNDLGCGDPDREYKAVCALLDLGSEAVPGLIDLLNSTDRGKRLEGARLLAAREGIDSETQHLVSEVFRDWAREIVKEYAEEAVPIFLNELKTASDLKRREIVKYLESLRCKPHKYAHLVREQLEST